MSDPGRPGKIIAVHLNYRSRAAQRGRTPAQPSYFFKPASSVAASGDALERPAGTELLAFEGEVALIIGRPARRVSPDEGWAAVSGITAANDFGLYDLRAADKGSNVRSKGGDGFTPLGPAIIPAAAVDPGAVRVRTWLNGELVQDGTSDDLLFPFGRLVADDYNDDVAADPRIDALRDRMECVEDPQFTRDYLDPDKRSIANGLTVEFDDGSRLPEVVVEYPIGHRRRRQEGIPLLVEKFRRSLALRIAPKNAGKILHLAEDQARLEATAVQDFVGLFVV